MKIEPQKVRLKNGKEIDIRSAIAMDAEEIARHKYITSQQTHFLTRYPEECNFNIAKLRDSLHHKENSTTEFTVTAFLNEHVIGDLEISVVKDRLKTKHRAHLGISIQKEYCNCGLGSIMLEIALNQSKLNGFEQVELSVLSDNDRAITLYEKKDSKVLEYTQEHSNLKMVLTEMKS